MKKGDLLKIQRISDLRQKYPQQEKAYLEFQKNIRYKNFHEILILAERYLLCFRNGLPDLTFMLEKA